LDKRTTPSESGGYKEFHPIVFKQLEAAERLEFETFNAAVDEFFSKIESQRVGLRTRQQEESAIKRLEAIREDHKARMRSLEESETSSVFKAQAIESNLEKVDQALFIVRSGLASGIDWRELEKTLDEEKKKGNPIAAMITSLNLAHNHMVLLLPHELDEDDAFNVSETESEKDSDLEQELFQQRQKEHAYSGLAKVEIDLSLSAFANARRYYDTKRQSHRKHEKTVGASAKVSFYMSCNYVPGVI
jgi:predicted ribosome quality control (RQC) complex YloA/Tae2 family protein